MRHQALVDVRGKGFLLGVELVKDRTSKGPVGKGPVVGPQAITAVGGRPAAQPEGRLRFRPSGYKALKSRLVCMPPLDAIHPGGRRKTAHPSAAAHPGLSQGAQRASAQRSQSRLQAQRHLDGASRAAFPRRPQAGHARVGVAGDLALLVGRHQADTNAPSAPLPAVAQEYYSVEHHRPQCGAVAQHRQLRALIRLRSSTSTRPAEAASTLCATWPGSPPSCRSTAIRATTHLPIRHGRAGP